MHEPHAHSTRLNGNVVRTREGGTEHLACAQCGQAFEGGPTEYLDRLPRYEAPASAAGPQIFAEPETFIDADVVFRQWICPRCATAIRTEVVPVVADS